MLLFFKALHVVGFIAWFAGLFYLVRMFVYHVESMDKAEPDRSILTRQYELMSWRVYNIITNPAMMITWLAGLGMLWQNPGYLYMNWLQVKLVLLVLLTIYQIYCKQLIKQLSAGKRPMNSFQFRLLNEVPTLFLVAISFIAVLGKAGTLHYGKLLLGMVVFIGGLGVGATAYKKYRQKKGQ